MSTAASAAEPQPGRAVPSLAPRGGGAQPGIIIVPGWRGSGEGHWQSLWASHLQDACRVEQDDWVTPSRSAWVAAVERAVAAAPGPVVIAAHSLGCIAVSHLGPAAQERICGALLVAPADPERRAVLSDFAPVPHARLPYRSIVVASSNDPYCPIRLAGAYARSWGSEFVRLQDAGHINVESGHGDWPLGLALLQSLTGALTLGAAPVTSTLFPSSTFATESA